MAPGRAPARRRGASSAIAPALLLLLLAAGAAAQQPPQLVDRIVAVVDEDPILQSELDEVVGLGLAQRRPGEGDDDFRARVLDELVRQRLRFHEVDRFGFTQAPVAEIERQVAAIRERLGGADALARRLGELRMSEDELRQHVARQLMVLTYVDERLGARVFVGLDDIRRYYTETLAPRLRGEGRVVPPLEEVREEVRALLKETRLNEEIERWTAELEREADVEVFLDEPRELPPVVHQVGPP
jgi:hypothetical protein